MKREPDAEAARKIQESTVSDEPVPPDLEAAWAAWIGRMQPVDERTTALLRAAFEAGAAAASRLAASEFGRRAGLKGGKARAAKLSKSKRAAIAKKAAKARWSKRNPDR